MRACVSVLLFAMLCSASPVGAAETGVSTPALSYCAHWFSRDGKACVTSAGGGQLVVPDANNPEQVNAAMNHCKRAGCKVALYCECGYRGIGVGGVAQLFANVVRQHGTGTIVNQVEVDHIRDISAQARSGVVRELAQHGFGLILKNSADVAAISGITPVVRVVYEDIVNDGQYRAEVLRLAREHPTLLITAIVHQGGYGGDAGASPAQADAVFAQFKDFKNVELFYGMPASYRRAKSFDGAMDSLARELGTGTLTPASLLGPLGQPDSRLLGNVRQMLQPSSPFSNISPPSGPLPSYLNPLQNTAQTQTPLAPSTLAAPTPLSALLDALGRTETATTSRTAITVTRGEPRQLASSQDGRDRVPQHSVSTTTVTTFPISPAGIVSARQTDAPLSQLLDSVRAAITGLIRLTASLLER